MKQSNVAIIVLNWNSADDTIQCIDSLLVQYNTTPDIILVDNNSADTSIEKLDKYVASRSKTNIHFIKNSINSGFSGGNNLGFRYALQKKYTYIGSLNPDAVASKNWVHTLVAELEVHPESGIATGTLAQSDRQTIDSTGEQYTTWGIPNPRGRGTPLASAPKKPGYVFGSTGGGFITRADMLRDIGLFDEKFFMYFEDVDLSFRAQLAGYKVCYTPKTLAYHKLSVSSNKVPGLTVYNTFKNLPILLGKNVPLKLWPRILPHFFLAYTLILGHAVAKGRGIPALKGFFMSIVCIPHTFVSRQKIQKSRKVSLKYIDSIIVHDIPIEQAGLRKFRSFFTGK